MRRRSPRVRGAHHAASGFAAFALLSFSFPVAAQPDGTDGPSTPSPDGRRIVSLGIVSGSGAPYPGARRREPFTYPTLEIRRDGEPFPLASPDDGFGVAILDASRFRLGPVAVIRQGTGVYRAPGAAHVPWTVEAGAFADFWPEPNRLRTRAEIRHGVRGNDGFALDLSADLFSRTGSITVSVGPRLAFLDARVAQLEFGAARFELRDPLSHVSRGGLESIGVSSAVNVDWSDAWRGTLYARLDHLVGDAGAVVARSGAPLQLRIGLGLTYSFRLDVPGLR